MEEVLVARMQAVEFARAILEARDAELAFMLQVQETVRTRGGTSHVGEYADFRGYGEELGVKCSDVPGLGDSHASASEMEVERRTGVVEDQYDRAKEDDDRIAALCLSVNELSSLVEERNEAQVAMEEAARLAHLDAIHEHDLQFARSLANMPQSVWDKGGHRRNDPFILHAPDTFPTGDSVEEFKQALELVLQSTTWASKPHGEDGLEARKLGLGPRTKLLKPVAIRENLKPFTLDSKKHGKGKLMLQEIHDENAFGSPSSMATTSGRIPSAVGHMHENVDNETDPDGACGQEVCQICFEATSSASPFFRIDGCGHRFCKTCNARHAESRMGEGQLQVTCLHAGCPTVLSYDQLSDLLSTKSMEILTARQIEAAIPDSEKVYCPFLDCSTLLMKPESVGHGLPSSSNHPHPTAVGCVECESCHRAFCMECAVPWHGGLSCAEYKGNVINRRLSGDEQLLTLADSKKWQRCQNCKRFVELTHGCNHMTCVCGHQFCYRCGAVWKRGSDRDCHCQYWDESRL